MKTFCIYHLVIIWGYTWTVFWGSQSILITLSKNCVYWYIECVIKRHQEFFKQLCYEAPVQYNEKLFNSTMNFTAILKSKVSFPPITTKQLRKQIIGKHFTESLAMVDMDGINTLTAKDYNDRMKPAQGTSCIQNLARLHITNKKHFFSEIILWIWIVGSVYPLLLVTSGKRRCKSLWKIRSRCQNVRYRQMHKIKMADLTGTGNEKRGCKRVQKTTSYPRQRPDWWPTLNCNVIGAYPRVLSPFTEYLDDVWSTRSVF